MSTLATVNDRHFDTAHWRARLRDLEQLPADWDDEGADVPNRTARNHAGMVLDELQANVDLNPTALLASVEGGVGISFQFGAMRAIVECLNTGRMLAAWYGPDGEPTIHPVPPQPHAIRSTLEQIHGFFHSADAAH